MSPGQTGIFIDSEGDNWYRRNRAALERFDPGADPVLQVLRQYAVTPRSVVEIGASNGFRVAAVVEQTGASGVAVEPSAEAVADGRKRYPRVRFVAAPAHDVPLDETFDLVIANFVLHWIDRALLLPSAAEIDRLVADGGVLVIGDFAPANPTKVPYHHLPERDVFTYKQNYAELFTASGVYRLVGAVSFAHSGGDPAWAAHDSDRAAVWLLRKSLRGYYADPHVA